VGGRGGGGEFQGEGSVLGEFFMFLKYWWWANQMAPSEMRKKNTKLNCRCTQVPSEHAGYVKLNQKL